MNGTAFTAGDVFLQFEYSATDFLIPIDDIVHITDEIPKDSCVVGTEKAGIPNCYIEVQSEGQNIFLTAHRIFGLVTVESDRQKNLPDAVKTEENEWIFATTFDSEHQNAMFLIDSHKIRPGEVEV